MIRVFDVFLSVLLLAFLAVLFPFVALAIKLSSPGPVLYRARRVGLNGREFTMLKFRTMAVRDHQGSAITSAADPRVFPLGALLRRLKIDEFPQAWNILTGDMSVVGPRPEDSGIVNRYYRREDRQVLTVRPGLSSPGSIYYFLYVEPNLCARSAEADYVTAVLRDKIALDMAWVEGRNLRAYVSILVRTLGAILATATGSTLRPPLPELDRLTRGAHGLAEDSA
ncbi:MAG: sugar transferase [Bryobacteraceae bacterium]|nr:sugar transferase [Bryobacteraceae bacterium]